MQFIIEIRVDEHQKRTYRIDADDEAEALERLKLRLPPTQRDNFVIDELKIDMTTVGIEEPYGAFGGE
jgi:hypothetical protein